MTIRLSNGNGKYTGRYPYFLTTAVVLITFCAPAGLSVENPSVRNPAGFGTVPQSTFGAGLIRSNNPFDSNGNLIVTGNVRRGSHFRGDVPYQSTATFGASLGTSTLSSFLRDSANSNDIGSYSGYRIQPYYAPAETVTTMSPGSPGVLIPADTRIDGRSTTSTSTSSGVMEVSDLAALQSRVFTEQQGKDNTTDGTGSLSDTRLPTLTEPQSMLSNQYDTEKLFPGTDLLRRQNELKTGTRQQEQLQRDKDEDNNNIWDPQQYESYLKNALEQSRESGKENLNQQNRIDGTIQPTDFGAFGQDENMPGMSGETGQADGNLTNKMPNTLNNYPSVDDTQQGLTQQDEYGRQETTGGYDTMSSDSNAFTDVQSSSSLMQSDTDTYDTDRRNTLEQIQRRLDTLIKNIERASVRLSEQKARNDELIPGLKERRLQSPQDTIDRRGAEQFEEPATSNYPPSLASPDELNNTNLPNEQDNSQLPVSPGVETNQNNTSDTGQVPQDSNTDVSARARNIMGKYTSLDSFSEAKFNEYFRAGQENLSAGRYYRAASAFTLASMYKPEDPLSLAGKGHALFAAGDYVSSALFISRALEFDPGYIRSQVNLSSVLGGSDKVEARISDVEEWLSRSGSEQLSFLLAYVCYRTDKLEKAKKAIDAAFEKMPQSIAVLAVKTAIEQDLTIQK